MTFCLKVWGAAYKWVLIFTIFTRKFSGPFSEKLSKLNMPDIQRLIMAQNGLKKNQINNEVGLCSLLQKKLMLIL